MQVQKNKKDELKAASRMKPQVIIHARPMDERQEQRLFTVVDAVLAEWVRQHMDRAQKNHE